MWWNDELQNLKKKEVLAVIDEEAKERCIERHETRPLRPQCKIRLVGAWREVVVGVRRVRSEKLREH